MPRIATKPAPVRPIGKPQLTMTELKEQLPDITVKLGRGEIVTAQLGGRSNDFAGVTWKTDGYFLTIQVSWETALRCYNTGTPISY
jgi:hypothetical protein